MLLLPGGLGSPRPWGHDPPRPKRVSEGSWSCPGNEFKDRHKAQGMSNGAGKFIQTKSTLSDLRAGQLQRERERASMLE